MFVSSLPRRILYVGIALLVVLLALDARALPAFARQTGQNCVACHAATPGRQNLAHAAAGLDFSAPGAVEKHRGEILRAAVFSRAMPPPGAAKPLDEHERLTLLRWAQGGS